MPTSCLPSQPTSTAELLRGGSGGDIRQLIVATTGAARCGSPGCHVRHGLLIAGIGQTGMARAGSFFGWAYCC
ncbi:MAG: hypothetical protein R3C56_17095 [Pirellulaceae bacterium]